MTRTAHEKPRIVLYTDATERGGAEVVLRNVLSGLDHRFDPVVMGPDRDLVRWLTEARPGVPGVVSPRVRGKADLAGLWKLRRVIARAEPDIFHANLWMLPAGQYALLAALLVPRLPVIAVEHAVVPPGTGLSRFLKRATSRRVAAHVAVSGHASSEVERLVGLPAGSVRTIYNGVPEIPVEPGPRLGPGPVVGALGRFEQAKGIDVLIRAVARLPGVTLALVGEGPEQPNLERLAGEVGIADRVVWRGWVDRPLDVLASLDILVLPSRNEAHPLVLLEAMTVGVPVVATDLPSTREIVDDGSTGVLFPLGDDAGLAAVLGDLLADRARRDELSCRASVAVECFGYEEMVQAYERLYDELLAAHPDRHARAGRSTRESG